MKKKKINKGKPICVCDSLCVLERAIDPPYWTRKEKMKATAKCWSVKLLEAGALFNLNNPRGTPPKTPIPPEILVVPFFDNPLK